MPKSKPKSVIAQQRSLIKKMHRAWWSQCRGSEMFNPRMAVLRRRYRAALKLVNLCSDLHELIGRQIADKARITVVPKARKK